MTREEELINHIREYLDSGMWKYEACYLGKEDLEVIIKALDRESETGHWILDETDNSITCDKCGCLIWANDISNGEAYYCPNCGMRMEG